MNGIAHVVSRYVTAFCVLFIMGSVALLPGVSPGAQPSAAPVTDSCAVPGMKEGAALLLPDKDYFPALARAVDCAKAEIVMAFFVFTTTGRPGNLPTVLVEKLIGAAGRGVNVTVVLEREEDSSSSLTRDNRQTAARLKKGGVVVYFDAVRVRTHTKAAVIDGRYVFLGSHNLSSAALKHNRELSVLIDSPVLAKEALDYVHGLYR